MALNRLAVASLTCLMGIALFLMGKATITGPWARDAKRYPTELAQAKAEGLPFSLSALRRPMPPPERNAATVYAELIRLFDANPMKADLAILSDVLKKETLLPGDREKLAQVLDRHPNVLRLIHRALALPECVFPHDWETDQPTEMTFPEFTPLRNAGRFLAAESLLLAYRGKREVAVANQAAGFRLANHARADGTLIAYLVGGTIDGITLRGLRGVLASAPDDARLADAVRKTVEEKGATPDLRPAIRSEAAFEGSCIDQLRRGDPDLKSLRSSGSDGESKPPFVGLPLLSRSDFRMFLDANAVGCLQGLRKINAVVDLPFAKAYPAVERIEKEIDVPPSAPLGDRSRRMLTSILFPVFTGAVSAKATLEARTGILRCGAAVLGYRARHNGKLPERLDEAVSPVPTDPFDGKPLCYRKNSATDFVVYSVGKDGTFDGRRKGNREDNRNTALWFRHAASI